MTTSTTDQTPAQTTVAPDPSTSPLSGQPPPSVLLPLRRQQPAGDTKASDDTKPSDETEAETNAPAITDDPHWTEGDFEIISADNVRFRVPSCYLLAHTPVFRTAQDLGGDQPKTVTLVDDEFETADVIRLFLSYMVKPERADYVEVNTSVYAVNSGNGDNDAFDYLKLGRFLLKYECVHLVYCLEHALVADVTSRKIRPVDLFAFGATLDNESLCVEAIRCAAPEHLTQHHHGRHYYYNEKCALNPTKLTVKDYSRIPATYLGALCRAWGLVCDGGTKILSNEFVLALRAAKREKRVIEQPDEGTMAKRICLRKTKELARAIQDAYGALDSEDGAGDGGSEDMDESDDE